MLTVPGIIDEEGQLHLEEKLLDKGKKAKVFVTLVEEISEEKPRRQLGRLKGTFTDPYWSSEEFNEPLDDLKERRFTFAVHKAHSERIQPGLDNPEFYGVVD